MSPSQAHRYLASYIKAGLVRQHMHTGLYDLGERMLHWGLAALARLDPVESAAQAAAALTETLAATSLVAVWAERGPTCVRWARGDTLLGSDIGLGTVFPLFDSATGLVFAAHLPVRVRERLAPAADATIEARLARVRHEGLAMVDGQFISSLAALSAPVFDAQHQVIAAVTVVIRRGRGSAADARGREARALLAAAQSASRANGWQAELLDEKESER
jgi:DNA-binding IclR family transcriptional regulator